jgi:hypothetical protein
MDNITNWLLEKIINNLVAREGCTKSPVSIASNNGSTAIITDAMGFRYEVQVKCIGRLKNSIDDKATFRSMF